MKLMLKSEGFALPTVLIASIVMMIVLLASLTSTSSISAGIRSQYYDKLAQEAIESGAAMAKACLLQSGYPTWSNGSPLRPNTGCNGGAACTTAQCYVVTNANVKTTFSVGAPTLQSNGSYSVSVQSEVQALRTSNGTVIKVNTAENKFHIKASGDTYQQVSIGSSFMCGINAVSTAYCWGYNQFGSNYGLLGNGTNIASSYTPVAVSTSGVLAGKTVLSIAGSLSNACAIASDYKAYCWGTQNDLYGTLGNNNTAIASSNVPVAVYTGGVLNGKTINKITAGGNHFCVIASDNLAYCWGENVVGDLGNNTSTSSPVPAAVAVYTAGVLSGKIVQDISAGRDHTCVVAADANGSKAYCWGYGYYGQLGNNSVSSAYAPVAVSATGLPNGALIQKISAGHYHTCAIASDSKAYCWGDNQKGDLGNASTTQSNVPVAVNTSGVLSGKTIIDIAAGYYGTCVIASDNKPYCWGRGTEGQLGNGGTTDSNVPVAVNTSGVLNGQTLTSITSVASGSSLYAFFCASTAAGDTFCWGKGGPAFGGNSTNANSSVPVRVQPNNRTDALAF